MSVFYRYVIVISALWVSLIAPVLAQQERSVILPTVEVDTTVSSALRILRLLQQHEKEDRLQRVASFDVRTEGDYEWTLKTSKFLRGYSRGVMSAMGFPRMAKIMIGHDTVSYKIHAHQHYDKGKLHDVDVRLDSSNLSLTDKQWRLLKRSNLFLDDKILTQFRSPKSPWGSKRSGRYDWLLVDTAWMYGHRVDILQYSSRPNRSRSWRMNGALSGRIWVIEDYWRIIGHECQYQKSPMAMSAHLDSVAPGVFLPRQFRLVEGFTIDAATLLSVMKTNPDSLSEKKRKKLESKKKIASFSMQEIYDLRMTYDNVMLKNENL